METPPVATSYDSTAERPTGRVAPMLGRALATLERIQPADWPAFALVMTDGPSGRRANVVRFLKAYDWIEIDPSSPIYKPGDDYRPRLYRMTDAGRAALALWRQEQSSA